MATELRRVPERCFYCAQRIADRPWRYIQRSVAPGVDLLCKAHEGCNEWTPQSCRINITAGEAGRILGGRGNEF